APRVPDLVLLPLFIPDAEEGAFRAELRSRSGGQDIPTLTIPLLGAPGDSSDRCEPRVFAVHVREYLRSPRAADGAPTVPVPDPNRNHRQKTALDSASEPDRGPTRVGPQPPRSGPALTDSARRERIVAAARAAASWARARRTAWTDAPLPSAPPAPLPAAP